MDLQNFVASALVQIVRGIEQAQQELKGTGALVNPGLSSVQPSTDTPAIAVSSDAFTYVRNVTFDIALTATDGKDTQVGGGLQVWAVRVGSDRKVSHEDSTVSRLQFTVPLALPVSSSRSEQERQSDFSRPMNYPRSGAV